MNKKINKREKEVTKILLIYFILILREREREFGQKNKISL